MEIEPKIHPLALFTPFFLKPLYESHALEETNTSDITASPQKPEYALPLPGIIADMIAASAGDFSVEVFNVFNILHQQGIIVYQNSLILRRRTD